MGDGTRTPGAFLVHLGGEDGHRGIEPPGVMGAADQQRAVGQGFAGNLRGWLGMGADGPQLHRQGAQPGQQHSFQEVAE